ncbi:MAG TPA: amino acid racemase [Brevundimonas sp.]|jgi:aspartate racemase|uniref:aspartate/glutamate racemase family protein n=1 Tax=Brevundimonas sp. TaxID=1871086 RepID=UPI002DECA052|nr:amino acid racemase [Brevundimonas sp.]
MKVLGVLGGMGPAATVAFLQRVLELTPAREDEDHVRVLMDMNPQVPNRHRDPPGAKEALGAMAARLRDMGAEVLAMPCNTAHAHADAIRAAGAPFLDMIELTAAEAAGQGATKVGVLATPGGQDLYVAELERRGLTPVVPAVGRRRAFLDLVFKIKAGDLGEDRRADMRALAQALIDDGAEALIAGCTEIPLVMRPGDVGVPLVDSAEVLARACVRECA